MHPVLYNIAASAIIAIVGGLGLRTLLALLKEDPPDQEMIAALLVSLGCTVMLIVAVVVLPKHPFAE